MNVLLIGPSGAGKTTLIKQIGGVDLDTELLKGTPFKTVAELIAKQGWDNFRLMEQETLLELLREKHQFIALGGGALNKDSWKNIKAHAVQLILLAVDFETCWERIKDDSEHRPLVLEGFDKNLARYDERMKFFKSLPLAKVVKSTDEARAFLISTKLVK